MGINALSLVRCCIYIYISLYTLNLQGNNFLCKEKYYSYAAILDTTWISLFFFFSASFISEQFQQAKGWLGLVFSIQTII